MGGGAGGETGGAGGGDDGGGEEGRRVEVPQIVKPPLVTDPSVRHVIVWPLVMKAKSGPKPFRV